MPTWDDVLEIAGRFPGLDEGSWYGTPGLKVRGKGIARLRTDPDALVLRVIDMGEREALLQGEPAAFFTIPHYDGHPYVLVRLDAVDAKELAELIEEAWRLHASKRQIKELESES